MQAAREHAALQMSHVSFCLTDGSGPAGAPLIPDRFERITSHFCEVKPWTKNARLHALGWTLEVLASVGPPPSTPDGSRVASGQGLAPVCPHLPGQTGPDAVTPVL